jgi:DNA-binding NarL/FixJ family response regulator
MGDEIRLLIADDHPIVRQGLRQIIESENGLRIIAESGDGRDALEKIEQLSPHIAILDVDMPEMDGFTVARKIRERRFGVEIVFLTVHQEESMMNQALDLGARGYVLKDSAVTDIVSCIRAVAAGRPFISPAMTAYLIDRSRRRTDDQKRDLDCLSPTERTVLKMIAEYKTTREIADILFISPRTVETHRANIAQKLNLRGSHALMKYALTHQTEL